MNVCASSKLSFYGGYPLNELIPTNYSQLLENSFLTKYRSLAVLQSLHLFLTLQFDGNRENSQKFSMTHINCSRIEHKIVDKSIDFIFVCGRIETWNLTSLVNSQITIFKLLVMSVNRFTLGVCMSSNYGLDGTAFRVSSNNNDKKNPENHKLELAQQWLNWLNS